LLSGDGASLFIDECQVLVVLVDAIELDVFLLDFVKILGGQ